MPTTTQRHQPIAWTQGATFTVTTRLSDLAPDGLSFYATTSTGGYAYASGDERRARRAHGVISRRLRRLEDTQ